MEDWPISNTRRLVIASSLVLFGPTQLTTAHLDDNSSSSAVASFTLW